MPDSRDSPRLPGPYTILNVIGHGGMGVVYRGQHTANGSAEALPKPSRWNGWND